MDSSPLNPMMAENTCHWILLQNHLKWNLVWLSQVPFKSDATLNIEYWILIIYLDFWHTYGKLVVVLLSWTNLMVICIVRRYISNNFDLSENLFSILYFIALQRSNTNSYTLVILETKSLRSFVLFYCLDIIESYYN